MSTGFSSLDWPTAAHFAAVLQNPKIAFRDAALKELKVHRDQLNQPRVWSGKFANVYKGVFPNGRALAVRVFTSAVAERRERYDLVARFLESRPLRCMVRFTYDDRGIRSGGNGKWYPLVTMEWVDGETLFTFARTLALQGDSRGLGRMAEQWIALAAELAGAGIAHGDLQHGNVMVDRSGQFKLVDYDCMYVPTLAGRKNLELGVDPYQHPGRNSETVLSPSLDNFSTIFIYTGLKALAAAPRLWKTFIDDKEYEKLLFRAEDLNDPQNSALVRELNNSPDSEVRRLCNTLVDLWQSDLDFVPRLAEVLLSEAELKNLLDHGEFDRALEMAGRFTKPIAAPLQARLQTAKQAVAKYRQLEQAAQSGNEEAILKAYDPLLDGYPKAQPLVKLAKTARQVLPLLQSLEAAKRANEVWKVVEIWQQNEPLLAGRKSVAAYEPLVRSFREAWVAVQKVPKAPSEDSDRRLLQAWKEPLFSGWKQAARERKCAVEAGQRLKLLDQIRAAAAAVLSPAGEKHIADLAAQLPSPYPHRLESRVTDARQRLDALARFQTAMTGRQDDAAIARLAQRLAELKAESFIPADQAKRMELATNRVARLARLEKEIPRDFRPAQGPQYDARLLEIWSDELFCDWLPASPWADVYRQAATRRRVLAELKEARADENRVRAAELAAEPCLEGYPLPHAISEWVREARTELESTRCLLDVVRQDRKAEFQERFDVRIVRKNKGQFEPFEERLREWIPQEILPLKKLGLKANPVLKAFEVKPLFGGDLKVRATWVWPGPRFSEQCVVAVCAKRPRPQDNPEEIATLRQVVDRKDYEVGGGGCTIRAHKDSRGSHLVVWALVDAGFDVFRSEPLVLGCL